MRDPFIKVIILRVDSGGGSMIASDNIYQAIKQLEIDKMLEKSGFNEKEIQTPVVDFVVFETGGVDQPDIGFHRFFRHFVRGNSLYSYASRSRSLQKFYRVWQICHLFCRFSGFYP
jgi:hypothetical protein